MKKQKAFVFKRVRPHGTIKNMPSFVSIEPDEGEYLSGSVQGKPASAPEERLAKQLDKAGKQYVFRYTLGAPRGLPGWKELDFLVSNSGLLYAIEVDTAFTHRKKHLADVLHDALILADQSISEMGELYPHVFHADGDSELASLENAAQYVKNTLGR